MEVNLWSVEPAITDWYWRLAVYGEFPSVKTQSNGNMASKKELAKLIKADPTAIETYMPQVLEMIRKDEDDLKRSDDLSDALTRPMLKEVKTK